MDSVIERNRRVACIGTRRLNDEQKEFCFNWGKTLAELGFVVASGGAEGADLAFMNGALSVGGRVVCYLPWFTYNESEPALKHLNTKKVVYTYDEYPIWATLAREVHPAWYRLSNGAKLLHARNSGIILDSLEVHAFPSPDRKGGTEQGIRLAKHLNIPVEILTTRYIAANM